MNWWVGNNGTFLRRAICFNLTWSNRERLRLIFLSRWLDCRDRWDLNCKVANSVNGKRSQSRRHSHGITVTTSQSRHYSHDVTVMTSLSRCHSHDAIAAASQSQRHKSRYQSWPHSRDVTVEKCSRCKHLVVGVNVRHRHAAHHATPGLRRQQWGGSAAESATLFTCSKWETVSLVARLPSYRQARWRRGLLSSMRRPRELHSLRKCWANDRIDVSPIRQFYRRNT